MKLMTRTADPKTTCFQKLPVFRGCSADEVRTAAHILDEAIIPAGSTLTRQSTPALQAFLIVHGSVEVSVDGQLTHRLGAGASVGLTALMNDWVHTSTVRALTDVRVLVFAPSSLSRLLLEVPACSRSLVRSALRNGGR